MNKELKNAYDLCELLRCALTGAVPGWREMDLQAVHDLAKMQTLTAISCMALEPVMDSVEPALAQIWKGERDKAVRKTMLLTAERQQILSRLDDMGCWYLPLKGSILAQLYPRIGMRQMADNDILFDPAYRRQVKELFLARGYECEKYGKSNHDVYQKAPVYNYEMHVALFNAAATAAIEAYYKDVASRLQPDGSMGKKFSDEDFYIYFLAHGYKHFSSTGNGLRFLLDAHVYLQGRTLDMDYVTAELQKLELADFEKRIRSMAEKLFVTGEALTPAEEEAFFFCVSSNTYGTQENRIGNDLRRLQPEGEIKGKTKVKYILRRLWPDQRWFLTYAPFFAKWRILKPFFLIWRFFRGIFLRGEYIAAEMRTVSEPDPKEHP